MILLTHLGVIAALVPVSEAASLLRSRAAQANYRADAKHVAGSRGPHQLMVVVYLDLIVVGRLLFLVRPGRQANFFHCVQTLRSGSWYAVFYVQTPARICPSSRFMGGKNLFLQGLNLGFIWSINNPAWLTAALPASRPATIPVV